MGFFEDLNNCFEGISAANKELVSDVKELAAKTKRDIISDWKREVPVFGNSIEKVDRAITTFRNAKEHFPDPSIGPFNPDLQLKKIMKKLVQDNKLEKDSKIKRAQHLKVNRFGYSHHALSIDGCEVIHYQDFIVKTESIVSFAKGADIHILDTPRLFTKEQVIARAYSKLGERKYNLIFNNCEHFVRWVLNGEE